MAEERQELLDVGDEEQVLNRDLEIKIRGRKVADRFNVVLLSSEGREFVWNLLNYCEIFHVAPLIQGEIARFEGRRDVGLWILNKCFTSDPDVYNVMQQEAKIRAEDEDI